MRPARNDLGDAHALLEHDDFLRALARGLVLDEARADDVVQQAWIAAIERGPGRPASLRAWLATAVRRLAWKLRRGEGRRDRHEQSAARREATPSVDEIVAREQARRRVVEAVLQLDEPNRTTLLLRYFERLPPRAIAERMGVPVETVRSRIKRSLETMRARLDAEHGGARATWAVALLPFARGAPAGLAAAGGAGVVAGAAALLANLAKVIGGVVVMSAQAKLALAGAAVVVAVGVTVLVNEWPSPTPPRHPGSVATSAAEVAAESAGVPARPAPAPEGAAREATPLETPKSVAAAPFGALHVKVVWGRDGTPAADVGVSGIAWNRPECRWFTLDATTDANGECRFDDVEAGAVHLVTDRGADGDGRSRFAVARGATTKVTLTIAPGADLLGIVDDDHGHGIADAEIWLSDNGCNPHHGRVLARSDANGAFRVRDLSGIRLIRASAPGWTPSIPFWVEGTAGAMPKVHLALRGPGGAVRGRVVDADGNAVKRALVELGDEEKHLPSPVDAKINSMAALLLTTTSDDDGRFRFDGAMLGAQPLAARDLRHAPWTGTVDVAAGATAEVEIRLAKGFTLDGRLVDESGAGVAGVDVAVNGAWGFATSSGRSGEDGRFRIDHLPAGTAKVAAIDEKRGRAKTTLRGAEGETVSWTGTLDLGLPIRGVVLDGDDAPVAGCVVQISGPQTLGEDFTMRNAKADADGRFVFENLVAGRYDVQISLPGPGQTPAASERDVQPSRDERIFRVSRAQRCSVWFEGTVADEAGRPIGDAHVTPYAVGGPGGFARAIVTSDPHTGRFRCGPYAPGDYRIQVKAEGLPLVTFPIGAVAADETREVGLLRVARGGTFLLRVGGPPGVALDELSASCYGKSNGMNLRTTISDGVVTCEPAAEGECVVRLTAKGCMNKVVHVTIVAGRVTELEAALAAGLPLALRIQLPADVRKLRDDPEGRAYARLLDANGDDFDGAGLQTPEGDRDGGTFLDWSVRLVPGRYRLEFVEGATILRALPFEIDAATRPDAQIELDAR